MLDYQQAGVSIRRGQAVVDRMKPIVSRTYGPLVRNTLGSFSAMVALPPGLHSPVLVSSADGVGTKLKIAIDAQTYTSIGIDLVAMNVNDLICCGAKPLYFLDYIAVHQLDADQVVNLVEGIASGCLLAKCALVGGETAEMNDLYQPNDFDIAGFATGVVEEAHIINGSTIMPGHRVYALPSSGLHSNGYSLVRKIITRSVMRDYAITYDDLLTPTTIYVDQIDRLKAQYTLLGIAHITGGGIADNLSRVLPSQVDVHIDRDRILTPPIFDLIQRIGRVHDHEMMRVFNMGVGMVVVSPDDIPSSASIYPIGHVVAGSGHVAIA